MKLSTKNIRSGINIRNIKERRTCIVLEKIQDSNENDGIEEVWNIRQPRSTNPEHLYELDFCMWEVID